MPESLRPEILDKLDEKDREKLSLLCQATHQLVEISQAPAGGLGKETGD